MTKEWLTSCQQMLDEALLKLDADESESVIIDVLTKIHGITEAAFQNCLSESPAVSADVKQRIDRVGLFDLIDWMGKHFPHVISEQVAEKLKEFNNKRNKAVHPRMDSRTGAPLFDVPSAEYVKNIGVLVASILQSLSTHMPPQPEPRLPELARTGEPSEPRRKARFPGQQDDERVIIHERRYWFTIIRWIRRPLLFLAVSLLIAWGVTSLLVPPSSPKRVFYGLAILAPALAWLIWQALDWRNDLYIVTDKRVIHIEKKYLTLEKRDEAPLAMVQDVVVRMQGLTNNLLYFGDVVVQTAGTLGTIHFRGIQKPRKVQAQIFALVSQVKATLPVEEEEPEATRVVREMVGFPKPKPKPLPAAAEGLRWESETPRRAQVLRVIKMMVLAKPEFGKNQQIWHKHWWVLLKDLTSPVLALVISFILWTAVSLLFDFSLWFDVPFGISLLAISVRITWLVIDWRNDLYVITDDRAVDIEKVPFLYEHRREAGLDKIQDVRYLQEGLIANRLDFGNVRLETAGGIGEFTFDSVPHPKQVQIVIFDRIARFHREAGLRLKEARDYEILDLLGRYHQGAQGDGGTES